MVLFKKSINVGENVGEKYGLTNRQKKIIELMIEKPRLLSGLFQ